MPDADKQAQGQASTGVEVFSVELIGLMSVLDAEVVVLPSDPRAKEVYAAFNRVYPSWDGLSIPDEFPWAIFAVAAETMNDDARASTYIQAATQRYGASGFAWPWYCAEASWYMRASVELQPV